MIESFLKEIGLSPKEIQIYIFLLKVDSTSVADIHLKTEVNRTTVYPVLKDLIEKGFVEEIEVKGKTQYRGRTPDYIETYLQEQKIKLEEQTSRAKNIIPQMKGYMREDGEKPIIEYYPDREGVINSIRVFFDVQDTKEGEVMHIMYPLDMIKDRFSQTELKKMKEMRVNKGIKTEAIYSSESQIIPSNDEGQRYRISSKEYSITADINIYGDRVRIHTLGETVGSILIKSKDIADTLKTLFALAIKGLEKS